MNHLCHNYASQRVVDTVERQFVVSRYRCINMYMQADEARFRADFQKRVKKIAFTDSVHNFGQQGTSSSVKRWMASVGSSQFFSLRLIVSQSV